MGGGPAKETLLFIFQADEPKQITDGIRHAFPYIDVVYHKLGKPQEGRQVGGIAYAFETIPDDLWQRATILVTLGSLPPKPDVAPNLKYIHLLSAGVDHFLKHPIFTETDIPITTVSGITGPAIAEWVLMTSLVVGKSYQVMYENQKAKKWDSQAPGLMKKGDWHGKTVGIFGYGSIGRQIARVYAAMGSKIYAFTASPKPTPEARKDTGYILPNSGDPEGSIPCAWYSGPSKADLHTFLASGLDMLVICVPLTDRTRGLFGEEEMEILFKSSMEKARNSAYTSRSDKLAEGQLPEGEGCIFVNLSRGAVAQTDAVTAALKAGKLQGAALDVTDPEPLPKDSELWEMDNVVITPHISALGREYLVRACDVLQENLKRREKSEKLVNEVDRKKGYRSSL